MYCSKHTVQRLFIVKGKLSARISEPFSVKRVPAYKPKALLHVYSIMRCIYKSKQYTLTRKLRLKNLPHTQHFPPRKRVVQHHPSCDFHLYVRKLKKITPTVEVQKRFRYVVVN